MIIPMPKKEYITIQMNPEHSSRYQVLTGALLERQQSDRSYLAACYLLSADDEIFDIAKPYVSFDGIDFAAIRMRVKKRFGSFYLARLQSQSPRDGTERAVLASDYLQRITHPGQCSQC